MVELRRHNRLGDFVRLLGEHKRQIKESMPNSHPINKYKHPKNKEIISTGELCVIFVNSHSSLAKRFCYGFGMESATQEQFQKMLKRLRDTGFTSRLLKNS
ncbi:MAG: hypothetical protein KAU35_06185, partial [candidate division Zixibacteria bacterium]|nr:hypothetical protein [candidate division Zixibacteria bacterium]